MDGGRAGCNEAAPRSGPFLSWKDTDVDIRVDGVSPGPEGLRLKLVVKGKYQWIRLTSTTVPYHLLRRRDVQEWIRDSYRYDVGDGEEQDPLF